MIVKRAFPKAKIRYRFWPGTETGKVLRAGLYARVSTNDQQTRAMQNRTMPGYTAPARLNGS